MFTTKTTNLLKWNKLKLFCVCGVFQVIALAYLATNNYEDGFGKLAVNHSRNGRKSENKKQFQHKRQSKSRNQFLKTQMSFSFTNGSKSTNRRCRDCAHKQQDIANCEVIHVAVVCTSQNTTRSVVTMLKSILFYRKNPLHFHFFSNAFTEIILDKLFKTWRLNKVQLSFYNTDNVKRYIKWIPTRHYNHGKGLMKLVFPGILPENIQKVIVLDADTIVVSDIAELWKLFSALAIKALGLVENQNNLNLGTLLKHRQPWLVQGRGYSTAVMLMNITGLRKLDWMTMWTLVAEDLFKTKFSAFHLDQDVTNELITRHPELVKTLPCQWNVQLSANTKSEDDYLQVKYMRIIHLNSPLNQVVKSKHIDYFLEYNGYLLWREQRVCETRNNTYTVQQQVKKNLKDDHCYEFRLLGLLEYRTHLFYIDFEYKPAKWDVTLISQLSMDKLQRLGPMCEHWKGPISVAIYLSDAEVRDFVRYVRDSETLNNRKNIGYHLVFRNWQYYPVNYLRNVAIENIHTDFMFLLDIDFLPMYNLHEYLKAAVTRTGLKNQKKALVVPAFEFKENNVVSFPKNKSELLSLLDYGEVNRFKYHGWRKGHAATNYDKWRLTTHPYTVKWKRWFEPYYVVNKNVSRYDQRFVGYGWNKISHSLQLNAEGYEFIVLPNAFIIHIPHYPSIARKTFTSDSLFKRCNKKLRAEFQREILTKYRKALK